MHFHAIINRVVPVLRDHHFSQDKVVSHNREFSMETHHLVRREMVSIAGWSFTGGVSQDRDHCTGEPFLNPFFQERSNLMRMTEAPTQFLT